MVGEILIRQNARRLGWAVIFAALSDQRRPLGHQVCERVIQLIGGELFVFLDLPIGKRPIHLPGTLLRLIQFL